MLGRFDRSSLRQIEGSCLLSAARLSSGATRHRANPSRIPTGASGGNYTLLTDLAVTIRSSAPSRHNSRASAPMTGISRGSRDDPWQVPLFGTWRLEFRDQFAYPSCRRRRRPFQQSSSPALPFSHDGAGRLVLDSYGISSFPSSLIQ
jgi:hypothetical protein